MLNIIMETTTAVMIAAYSVFSVYVLYILFFRKNPYRAEYEKLYNEIMTSDKYKVKGQYENQR